MLLARHKLTAATALLSACLCFAMKQDAHAAPPASEAELKSVLLFHLTQFVTWPAGASNRSEFIIGILGPDPLGPALDAVIKSEQAGGRPIRVVRSNRLRELSEADLIYVSPQTGELPARLFDRLKERTVLTVGESSEFLDDGGMVRFKRTQDRKIRLQIHLTRARESGFHINAQLLRVSDVVQGGQK